ncbi:hypothetical protein CROQUDRAFT_134920 [Cronartium quercuum f. sp. fusiforme G11]|uniref:Uncharacterized protein n=1 Tax=Cronartium quercuum f. sp. fusiforme G11 TaxID=708437 RepID=A0A9P6NH71_9BASI|nr:hypothetical protein CROQUDRAFT_134920 [Cronartium quercuum f. sp. fusiforme G11]
MGLVVKSPNLTEDLINSEFELTTLARTTAETTKLTETQQIDCVLWEKRHQETWRVLRHIEEVSMLCFGNYQELKEALGLIIRDQIEVDRRGPIELQRIVMPKSKRKMHLSKADTSEFLEVIKDSMIDIVQLNPVLKLDAQELNLLKSKTMVKDFIQTCRKDTPIYDFIQKFHHHFIQELAPTLLLKAISSSVGRSIDELPQDYPRSLTGNSHPGSILISEVNLPVAYIGCMDFSYKITRLLVAGFKDKNIIKHINLGLKSTVNERVMTPAEGDRGLHKLLVNDDWTPSQPPCGPVRMPKPFKDLKEPDIEVLRTGLQESSYLATEDHIKLMKMRRHTVSNRDFWSRLPPLVEKLAKSYAEEPDYKATEEYIFELIKFVIEKISKYSTSSNLLYEMLESLISGAKPTAYTLKELEMRFQNLALTFLLFQGLGDILQPIISTDTEHCETLQIMHYYWNLLRAKTEALQTKQWRGNRTLVATKLNLDIGKLYLEYLGFTEQLRFFEKNAELYSGNSLSQKLQDMASKKSSESQIEKHLEQHIHSNSPSSSAGFESNEGERPGTEGAPLISLERYLIETQRTDSNNNQPKRKHHTMEATPNTRNSLSQELQDMASKKSSESQIEKHLEQHIHSNSPSSSAGFESNEGERPGAEGAPLISLERYLIETQRTDSNNNQLKRKHHTMEATPNMQPPESQISILKATNHPTWKEPQNNQKSSNLRKPKVPGTTDASYRNSETSKLFGKDSEAEASYKMSQTLPVFGSRIEDTDEKASWGKTLNLYQTELKDTDEKASWGKKSNLY